MIKAKVQASQKTVSKRGKPKILKNIKYVFMLVLLKLIHIIVNKIIMIYRKNCESKLSSVHSKY